LNDWFAEGATAEFCITKPSYFSLKPSSLSDVEAASAPIGSLTAWQGCISEQHYGEANEFLYTEGQGRSHNRFIPIISSIASCPTHRDTAFDVVLSAKIVSHITNDTAATCHRSADWVEIGTVDQRKTAPVPLLAASISLEPEMR
jgi:hypothetical protein